jgi:hypothetical protein
MDSMKGLINQNQANAQVLEPNGGSSFEGVRSIHADLMIILLILWLVLAQLPCFGNVAQGCRGVVFRSDGWCLDGDLMNITC